MAPSIGDSLHSFTADERPSPQLAWLEQGRVEVQGKLDRVCAVRAIEAEDVERYREQARANHLTAKVHRRLRGEGTAEPMLRVLFRDQPSVHLGTRIADDGSLEIDRAFTAGGVLRAQIASDGELVAFVPIEGFGGLLLLDEADAAPALPDRHAKSVSVRSFGEAYLHALAAGADVQRMREDHRDRHRIQLVCGDHLRSYVVADRTIPARTHLGDLSAPGLGTALYVASISRLARSEDPTSGAVGLAVCERLLAQLEGERLPETDESLHRAVRAQIPTLFERAGLESYRHRFQERC